MKKKIIIACALSLIIGVGVSSAAYAAPENTAARCADGSDNDKDKLIDCADPDCAAFCGSSCTDTDSDGYGNPGSSSCPNGSATDCNNNNASIYPGATEICGDGIDQDCNGSDLACPTNPHQVTGTFNTPKDVTAKCLTCHSVEGSEAVSSLHGMMAKTSPKVTNDTGLSQKLDEINTFCSYPNPDLAAAACLNCHPTLGKFANLAAADIDCLMCHNDAYKRMFAPETNSADYINVVDWQGTPKTYIPADKDATGNFYVAFDWANMAGQTATSLIAGVHRPTTTTCLRCHAKAGGADWAKRGDMGVNSATATAAQDVHLASVANGGAGLICSSCHVPVTHQIPGRGIDLRPTEGGTVTACATCHDNTSGSGFSHLAAGARRSEGDRHINRVACQSCHIPAFGKGGPTEMSRNWTVPHWNAGLCNGQGAWVGEEIKASNVAPDHVWFNGTSYVYSLGQTLTRTDAITGALMQADANGGVNDALGTKLVPVKRHQSNMAVMSSGTNINKLIPYDVAWQFMTGKSDEAAERGKAYAGFTGTHQWKWLEAEMEINHGVSPAASVAACTSCHHGNGQFSTAAVTKLDKLGYKLKDANKDGQVNAADEAIICAQCHAQKAFKRDWEQMHAHTAKGSGIGCGFCHDISRPERGLCEPCNANGTENTACRTEFVDNNYYDHCPN